MRQGGPLKIPHIVSFCCIFFFRDHHDLGEKWRNMRSNRSEDLFFIFFRDHHDFGKNKGNTRSKPLFFLKNTNFWESLPRAPNFEYPSLCPTLFSFGPNFKSSQSRWAAKSLSCRISLQFLDFCL